MCLLSKLLTGSPTPFILLLIVPDFSTYALFAFSACCFVGTKNILCIVSSSGLNFYFIVLRHSQSVPPHIAIVNALEAKKNIHMETTVAQIA